MVFTSRLPRSDARCAHRSGDVNFINKQPCRLKDIHDLFTDYRFRSEGYANIGQGQIDVVLCKSQDCRILLEERLVLLNIDQKKKL